MTDQPNSLEIFEIAIQQLEANEVHFELSISALEAAQLLSVLYQALDHLDIGIYKSQFINAFAAALISMLCEANPELHKIYDAWGFKQRETQ